MKYVQFDFHNCTNQHALVAVCSNGQEACPSGECIMSEWMCDGRNDCPDGWDEMNCDSKYKLHVHT